jgi:uncharacterized protein YjiK
LLLKNGHVLILKEKNPLKIVEFAPSNSAVPAGFNAKLSLEIDGEFPRPQGKSIKFVPVHYWEMTEAQKKELPDGSGLNVNQKGELFLLSDQGLSIAKIGKLDPSTKGFEISQTWKLPKEIKKPEGMVFDHEGRVLIATDAKKPKGSNFFVLEGF